MENTGVDVVTNKCLIRGSSTMRRLRGSDARKNAVRSVVPVKILNR